MAKISDLISAREQTKQAKAGALAAAAAANQAVTDTTASDDAQKAREARGLKLVGPVVIGTTLYESPDGLDVHESTVNLGDADVPDDGPSPGSPVTSPAPTAPTDGGIASPLTAGETAAP